MLCIVYFILMNSLIIDYFNYVFSHRLKPCKVSTQKDLKSMYFRKSLFLLQQQ